MTRFADWPVRLAQVLAAAETREFRYGRHDCALFVARVVEAITGTDPLARVGMAWSGRRGAEATLVRHGGLFAATATAMAACGSPEIPPRFARRGDVVALTGPFGPTLGICVGERIAAAAAHGIGFVPLTRGARAWRV